MAWDCEVVDERDFRTVMLEFFSLDVLMYFKGERMHCTCINT